MRFRFCLQSLTFTLYHQLLFNTLQLVHRDPAWANSCEVHGAHYARARALPARRRATNSGEPAFGVGRRR